MIEQITLLETIRTRGKTELIPDLFDLYAARCCDAAVDEMLYHTLYALLERDGEHIAAGLRHPAARIRRLCVRSLRHGPVATARQLLLDLLARETDSEVIADIIGALETYADAGMVDALLPYINHDDSSVAGLAVQVLSQVGSDRVCIRLCNLVSRALQNLAAGEECDLRLALAIQALANFREEEVVGLLVRHIHHDNPVVRRLVSEALAAMGPVALPALEKILACGSAGEKVLAAKVIGKMGDIGGVDSLAASLEKEKDPTLKFAVYQALSDIASVRSMVGLTDGLEEADELALIAVLHGLELLCSPEIVSIVREKIVAGGEQAERILQALVTARSTSLFEALYTDPEIGDRLVEAVRRSGDPEAVAVFRNKLREMINERAWRDFESLPALASVEGKRILVADESTAMHYFYRSVAAELGLDILTTTDGLAALRLLRRQSNIHALVTELNMPLMSGVELVREVRRDKRWRNLPVLVATTEKDQPQLDLARAAGADDWIIKPFNRNQFRKKIEEVLGRVEEGQGR